MSSIVFAQSTHVAVQDNDRAYMERIYASKYVGTDTALVEVLEKNTVTGQYDVVDMQMLNLYVYAIPPVLVTKLEVDYWLRAGDGLKEDGDWRRVENMLGKVNKGKK